MVLDNDGVGTKTTKEKVKSLALKAKVTREQTSDDSDSQGESDEDINKKEAESFNLMGRNFRKFFRKGNRLGHGNRFGNGGNQFGKGHDYPIWEIIQKGNGPVQVSTDTNGQIKVLPPKKLLEKILASRERKESKGTHLDYGIPAEDHLVKFHKMTDAKEMWEAIKSRIVSSTEDANQKFLRVFKYDIKGSIASSSSTQNVAFVSSESTNSTNDVSTAYGVSTSSGHNLQKEGSSSYTDEHQVNLSLANHIKVGQTIGS
ncbi:hypothetical protein Tco_1301201 [Tanacetum coccineum]